MKEYSKETEHWGGEEGGRGVGEGEGRKLGLVWKVKEPPKETEIMVIMLLWNLIFWYIRYELI